MNTSSALYPPIEPYATHRLATDGHDLYLEECGNPAGMAVVFLHGGPGAGCDPLHRCFFDPEAYHIILFDQRGAGRSKPHAGLDHNTTWHLVADMELIRTRLGIERWLVFGGSWGSTLALAYAQTHPDRVIGLILRGIFLCRPKEIQWFYQEGASWIFPDYWQDYLAPIPGAEHGDLLWAYYQRLTGANEIARLAAAKAWSLWEGRTSTLLESSVLRDQFASARFALALACIECHYFLKFRSFHHATSRSTAAISGFLGGLPVGGQSIPKPSPSSVMASARRTSAKANSVVFCAA